MNMKITRDVIADLWPLYADGSVSADSRALIEEFLKEDPQWAQALRQGREAARTLPPPVVTPDQEAQVMNRIKRRMHMRLGVLLLAMMFTMQAFGRIVADTTWTGSPRVFIIMASLAGVCWIAFLVILMRHRRLGPVG